MSGRTYTDEDEQRVYMCLAEAGFPAVRAEVTDWGGLGFEPRIPLDVLWRASAIVRPDLTSCLACYLHHEGCSRSARTGCASTGRPVEDCGVQR